MALRWRPCAARTFPLCIAGGEIIFPPPIMNTKQFVLVFVAAFGTAFPNANGQAVTPSPASGTGAAPLLIAKEAVDPSRTDPLTEKVQPPVLLSSEPPRYSDKARKNRLTGVVQISLMVDEQGLPQYACVLHGLKWGLNEEALKAVSTYRFKPAMKGGKPVPVAIKVSINFQIT